MQRNKSIVAIDHYNIMHNNGIAITYFLKCFPVMLCGENAGKMVADEGEGTQSSHMDTRLPVQMPLCS